jgi:hypothetical protein
MGNEKKTNFMITHSAAMKVEGTEEIEIVTEEGSDENNGSFIIKRVENAK